VAENLASELKEYGLSVTHPNPGFALNYNVALRVGKALEKADAIVVLLSPKAVKSEQVRGEIEYAVTSPRFHGRLVPVMIKKTGGAPWILHELNMLDASADLALLGREIAARFRRAPGRAKIRFIRSLRRRELVRA
jgi:hypothetical protein